MNLTKYSYKSIFISPCILDRGIFILNVFLLFILSACQQYPGEYSGDDFSNKNRYKSIHLFAREEIDSLELEHIKDLNINSIVLVPFLYQRGLNTDTVISPGKNSYEWTEREDGIIQMARICQKNGLELILKPHIWPVGVKNGEWREAIEPDSSNWQGWARSYEKAILNYAEICEEENIAILCIGTELKQLALAKPEYWKSMIKKVRNVYSGKLCYAANWYDEYEKITFWNELDYIGIQAYFPISSLDSSNYSYMKAQWLKYCKTIKMLSDKFNKPVLITELGYKSSIDAGVKPWLWDEHWGRKGDQQSVSEDMQAQCFKVFFETVWKEDWCKGVFIWNWKSPYHRFGGPQTSTFTPQRKKSEQVIKYYFK